MWERACVGAGLSGRRIAAMQTPRYISCTEVMLSQASQLPQRPAPTLVLCTSFQVQQLPEANSLRIGQSGR